MENAVKNPSTEPNSDNLNVKSAPIVKPEDEDESKCGLFGVYPFWMQQFRTTNWAFFLLCWASILQGFLVNGLVNVVITTIERRYQMKSTDTGMIASGYDIASFLFLIPVSYFGGHRSKPLFIGIGVLIMGKINPV